MKEANYKFLSESNEWFTPPRYLDLVRKFLGGIALDPASSAKANRVVLADKFFNITKDGLAQSWRARNVFVNPPYGKQPGVIVFVNKMSEEFRAGHFKEGVLLTLSKTSERWFQPLWQHTLCFTNHRVKYVPGGGAAEHAAHTGQLLHLFWHAHQAIFFGI